MRIPRLAVGALFVLIPSLARAADPRPTGAEVSLGTCSTCRQQAPAVAGTPSGAFVAVWEGGSAADSRGLLARFFTTKGKPRGSERLVNRSLPPEQYDAAVAADSRNDYVVAWSEVERGDSDVLVQRFKSTGAPVGAEIRVSVDDPAAPEPAADYAPAVAAMADGGFFVAWIRFVPPGATSPATDPEVMVRRFDKTGKPLGAQARISAGVVKGTAPDVCVLTSGGAAVVWTSLDERRPFEPSLEGISLRRLAPSGSPAAPEQIVLEPEADGAAAAVSCGRGNTFVVAYGLDLPGITDDADVFARRFTRMGRPAAGPALRVNTTTGGRQRSPAISHDQGNNFVVVWSSSTADGEEVVARRIGPNGTPLSNDVVAHRATVATGSPDVAHPGRDNGFVVVWQEGVGEVMGRRFIP